MAGMHFRNYGAHCDDYPCSYITVAAAIGTQPGDIDAFLGKLGACLVDYQKRIKPLNKQTGLPEGPVSGMEHPKSFCIRFHLFSRMHWTSAARREVHTAEQLHKPWLEHLSCFKTSVCM